MAKAIKVSDLTVDDRIERAKSKTDNIVRQLVELIHLHAANQIINYSGHLSDQIPRSYGAQAFNYFQISMYRAELMRICSILDPCRETDLEMVSIPAVVNLVRSEAVLDALEAERAGENFTPIPPIDDPDFDTEEIRLAEAAIYTREERIAHERTRKSRRGMESAIRQSEYLVRSDRLRRLKNFRDKYVAHSLEKTNLEKRETVANAKYGDEQRLLHYAIAIADKLHVGINGMGMKWKGNFDIAEIYAKALWHGCTFKVLK